MKPCLIAATLTPCADDDTLSQAGLERHPPTSETRASTACSSPDRWA